MSDSEDSDFSDNQSERSSDGEAEEVENEVRRQKSPEHCPKVKAALLKSCSGKSESTHLKM